jgi:hypothetical protein
MRPVKCRGLPIFLFHSVFAQYILLSKKALPAISEARTALQVARRLCNTMGDYFVDEPTRTKKFIKIIKPLFSRWMTTTEVTSQGTTAPTRTGATISEKGTIMVLTEIKNGKSSGDPYMQACRGYEINTEALSKKKPNLSACGAPTFICCLNGQSRLTLNSKYIC